MSNGDTSFVATLNLFSFPANFSFPPPRRGLLQTSFVAATMETGMGMPSEN